MTDSLTRPSINTRLAWRLEGLRKSADRTMPRLARRVAERRLAQVDRNPSTFTGKVLHKMAFDRRPILQTVADKHAVQTYVADRVGATYLKRVYATLTAGDPVPWDGLPRQFVAKATQGSGACVIVSNQAPAMPLPTDLSGVAWQRFALHPDAVVQTDLERLCAKWRTLDYSWRPGRLPEWCYEGIRPRVLFEELLTGADGELPEDYKFFVFDGICQVVMVDTDRFGDHRRDTFTREWKPLPVTFRYPRADRTPGAPDCLAEMVKVAEELGRQLDFVRVDLYEVGGRVVFGELTNYPEGGRGRFDPLSFDEWLGSGWTLC